MNDDHIDELLLEAARDYNAPARIPREEMWARIQSARQAAQPLPSARRLWVWPSVGVAAAVLLAVGVVVGQRLERATSKAPTQVAASTKRDSVSQNPRSEGGSAVDPATALSYQLVVLKHLAGSEAMITAFRSSARRGEVDAQIASWSKDLLSTTRMLEASAAADDPMTRRLLQDLDLVLAQIKQYVTRGTNNPDDLDLIEQSIIKRGVITKLRSTLPARNAPAGL